MEQGKWFIPAAVSNPLLGATVLDTGSITTQGAAGDYIKMSFHFTNGAVTPTLFNVGVYDGTNALVGNAFNWQLPATNSTTLPIDVGLFVPNGFSIKIKTPVAVVGTVQASISYSVG